jgi:hypothetical protein
MDSSDPGYGPVVGFCERSNDPLFHKRREISWVAQRVIDILRRTLLHEVSWMELLLKICHSCSHPNSLINIHRYYILLWLRGGIAQGVPRTATIPDLLRFSIWVIIIPEWPARVLGSKQQTHLVANQEKFGETFPWILPTCITFLL